MKTSDDLVIREENCTHGDFSPRLRASVVRFCLVAMQTLHATLREIFDESAYDRFLLRTSKAHSSASYRDFTRERDAAMAKKPRCC